jgi:hypothetical protein
MHAKEKNDHGKNNMQNRIIWLVLLGMTLSFYGCVTASRNDAAGMDAGPAGERPGLAVIYIFKKYRSVDQVPVGDAALRMGRQGTPVLMLDHQSGRDGNVFASGRSQSVAMVLDGFLKLEKIGTYRFQALANDGIRMFLNGQMVFEDPKVHKDRLSPAGEFHVDRPGKYPVRIVYFQRKGTAALKLYWQPPGAEDFSLVPAEVYLH